MYFLIALVLLLATCAFGTENIALGKLTWQEHPWTDPKYYRGDNAVDGLYTDRSLPGGQCSMSKDNQYTATWRVDLGSVFSISHINIYYITNNELSTFPTVYARRMAGFYLYVSNTTSKENGHLCFHENQTKLEMILEDISINCSVSGRYVIYYNERRQNVNYPKFYSKYAYNELCEVEVYGCNVSIHNGDICTNTCPKNCQEGQCDINSDHCLKCIPGYQGPLCDQACKDNDCTDPCNTNCVNQTCHQVTGNCFSKNNITNKSILTTSDAETIGPTIVYIICGTIAAIIIIIVIIVAIALYKRTKSTKGEQEETRRRNENITESTTTNSPTQNTVEDFWLMVWQEHVEQIVMLTNLKEGPKTKCYQYWPDLEETMACDMFTLHTISERHYACYSIRILRLTCNKERNERRTITQYHYTAWPDHGTPDPLCLLMFHNHVTRTKLSQLKVSILVHCSAGIGRTGTYIAIDALYEEGQQKSKINIADYVRKMREKRMNMVQTYEQYKTIFLTLYEMFKSSVGVQKAQDYLLKLQLAKKDHPAYNISLREEFQRLLSIRHQYSENDFKMALQYKSVTRSILPLDKYVMFLTSSIPKRGNYINAISLLSFTCQNTFIVTHYPTRGDSVDFIRLITDYESEVVVCMEPLCHVESANEWLPTATRSKTVSPYKIQQQKELSTEIKCRKLEIAKEKPSDEIWLVDIVEPDNILTQDNSQTASQILSLVSFVQNVETNNPITVVSSDGASLCGVFCAVYNLIQQLTMDEEIDVFSAVRLLQTRRPELCSSMEEYTMIQDALMRFLG